MAGVGEPAGYGNAGAGLAANEEEPGASRQTARRREPHEQVLQSGWFRGELRVFQECVLGRDRDAGEGRRPELYKRRLIIRRPLMDLSVVIPAYNESLRLGPTLRRVIDYLRFAGIDGEVLVVDDGSTDSTAEVAGTYAADGVKLLRQKVNRGKGAALKRGVLASRGREVLLLDADLSTPIEELATLRPHLRDAGVVLGSRATAESRITRRQPLYRELMGRTFNLFVRLLAVRGLGDTQCGFKLLDGEVARRVFAGLTVERFAYDVEMVWLARRQGCRVVEVGVPWADSPRSSVNPVTDSARMLWDIVAMRLRHGKKDRG
jgi:dolichyl-phosphate beta-glucosyltransferase